MKKIKLCKTRQQQDLNRFKISASRFFLMTWLTKGKFLCTEEYKHIDSMHIDSIFLSLQIVYAMYS